MNESLFICSNFTYIYDKKYQDTGGAASCADREKWNDKKVHTKKDKNENRRKRGRSNNRRRIHRRPGRGEYNKSHRARLLSRACGAAAGRGQYIPDNRASQG